MFIITAILSTRLLLPLKELHDIFFQPLIMSPMEYKHSAGVKFDTVFKTSDTAKLTYKAVQRILTNEVYIGVLAQMCIRDR